VTKVGKVILKMEKKKMNIAVGIKSKLTLGTLGTPNSRHF
jgi:hypothetical protein